MSEPRLIKKYENRRLYDTVESRYVNLEEVAKLVRDGTDIQVVDAKSGEDLTRSVLTQIIVEDSRGAEGGPPLEFLRDLVRSTDRAQKDFLQWYLGTAANAYQKMQDTWKKQTRWPSMDEQREAWAKMFDPFGTMRSVMRATRPTEKPEEEPDSSSPADLLADLKQRLEDLEDRLGDK